MRHGLHMAVVELWQMMEIRWDEELSEEPQAVLAVSRLDQEAGT